MKSKDSEVAPKIVEVSAEEMQALIPDGPGTITHIEYAIADADGVLTGPDPPIASAFLRAGGSGVYLRREHDKNRGHVKFTTVVRRHG